MVNFVKGEGCRELGDAFAARFFGLRLLGLVLFTSSHCWSGCSGSASDRQGDRAGTDALVWTQGVSRRRWASRSSRWSRR